MKRLISTTLFLIAFFWMAVVLFKVFLAFDGYVDHLGRGPVEHLTSAFFQFLFVLGLVWFGKKIRPAQEQKTEGVFKDEMQ